MLLWRETSAQLPAAELGPTGASNLGRGSRRAVDVCRCQLVSLRSPTTSLQSPLF